MATGAKAKPAKTKSLKLAKKAAVKKAARPGGTNVRFGLHGLRKIMNGIHHAGLEDKFNDQLADHQFVNVNQESLSKIKDFVTEQPKLKGLADEINKCNCPPDDPYCIYI